MLRKAAKRTCDFSTWSRRLAKLSLVFVFILLLESYRDSLSVDYSNRNWTKHGSDSYHKKLDDIIKHLENLQPVISERGPANYSLQNRKGAIKEPILLQTLSTIPCELGAEPSVDWNHFVKPRFRLDPHKLLYPILKNQPVDQLIGLRQSILLAVKLNRTLVLPYFHNHNYGGASQYNPALSPELKVNVDVLRKFISVISAEEMQTQCRGKFDVVLASGHIDVLPGTSSLLKAQSELTMKMLNTQNTSVPDDFRIKFKIPSFPRKLKTGTRLNVLPSKVNSIYPKETAKYRCAVHPFPLSLFDVKLFQRKSMKLPNHKINIFKLKEEVLYSSIWYHTQPPLYIHSLASDVIDNVIKAQQIDGVYNFMCLNYHKHAENQDEDIDVNTMRAIIETIIDKVSKIDGPLRVTAIYISSPRSKQSRAKSYRDNLKIFHQDIEIPVYSAHDTVNSWKKYFHGVRNSPESLCALLEDDTQDALSFVEMQICTEAAVFVRSIASSWAANVQANRQKTDYSSLDASIRDLVNEQLKMKDAT